MSDPSQNGSNSTAVVPVILCGGAGSRLWPASRDSLPKQFAHLLGPRSTFQDTILRAAKIGTRAPVVLTNQAHIDLVRLQLDELGVPADVLIEPERRDSGPAIAAACVKLREVDKNAIALVLAADHVVADQDSFRDAVFAGVAAAADGYLVTFGVTPTHAETSFGYIEAAEALDRRAFRVASFAEKPSPAVADDYVRRGLLWNSGNFLFRAQTLLEEYSRFDDQTVLAVDQAYRQRRQTRGGEVLGASYGSADRTSVDYAVLEKTAKAAVVQVSCGWSDIGSWEALWEFRSKDSDNNVTEGKVEILDSSGCLVSSDGPLIALIGLRDLAVVSCDGAVLVTDRSRAADVKKIVERLRNQRCPEADTHSRVHRPWGNYHVTDAGEDFQVKRIIVNPGGRLSLQKHRYRAEHWVVVKGRASVTVGDQVRELGPNEHAHIPLGAVHRLENFGNVPVELVEVQCGSYLGEDDIVRLEDVYQRIQPEVTPTASIKPESIPVSASQVIVEAHPTARTPLHEPGTAGMP